MDKEYSGKYNRENIQKILNAYNTIFPDICSLTDYLDLKNKPSREWSCLTTNFQKINIDTVNRFELKIAEIEKLELTCATKLGYEYKKLSDEFSNDMKYKVGFSLGISTWTDFLLEKTFSKNKKDILIFLGHDWYPIITASIKQREADMREKHPRYINNINSQKKYGEAIPDKLFKKNICLFLNLCPDFRPPATSTKGTFIKKREYEEYAQGFDMLCKAINKKYKIVGIFSWGDAVWKALQPKCKSNWQYDGSVDWSAVGIMNTVYEHDGKYFEFSDMKLPYYPFAHPAYGKYFLEPEHSRIFNKTINKFV